MPKLRLAECFRSIAAIVAGAAALSCVGGTTEPLVPSDAVVTKVVITPSVPAQVTAGGTLQLTATASNAEDQTVPGNTVTWSSTAPTIASVSTTGLVTGTLTGSSTITATVSTITATGVAVTVIAGPPTQLGIRTQPSASNLGAAFAVQPVIEVRDAEGNVTTSTTVVTAAIATGGGTLSGTAGVAAVAGVATFSGLAVTGTAGNHTLTFTAAGLTAATSATFAVSTGVPAAYTVTSSSLAPVAGAAVTITAQLVDANGSPVATSGRVITWSNTGAGGTFGAPTSTTDANGQATVQFTTSTTAAVTYVVTGTDTGALKGSTGNIKSVAGAASKYVVTSSSLAPVDGSAVTITAVYADANGNAVATAGRVVTWSATGAGGTFGSPTSTTDATGTATVQFTTSTTVATYVVTGTDNGAIKGSSPNIVSVAGPASTAKSVLTAVPTSLPADGHSTSAITLQLEDANSNLLHSSGGTVVISTTAGTMSATTDNHDGTYSAALTAPSVVGSAVVSATLGGVAVTSTATVTITTNTATQYVITSSAPSPTAGSAVTITAQLANSVGGPVATAGKVVTWSLTGVGGTFGAPTSTTLASGIATVTFTTATTAGLATVKGTDAGLLTGSLAVTSVAGAATQIAVNAGNNQTATAGTVVPTAPSVLVRDVNNNPVSGVSVTFAVATGGGSLTGGAATTNASGIAALVSWTLGTTPGSNTLTATATGLTGSPLTFTATGAIGAATKYVVTSTSTTPVTGAAVTVTAQATDANNNPVSLAGQTVTWSAVGETGGVLAPTSSITSATGAATTSYTTGTSVGTAYTINAVDGSARAGNVSVTNTAGTPSSLSWSRASHIVITDTAYSAAAFTGPNQFGRTVTPPATYVSRTAAAATVSAAGLVTPVTRGLTMLVAAATANASATDSVLVGVWTAGSPVVRTDLTRFDLKNDTTFAVTAIADMPGSTLLGSTTVTLTWDPTQLTYVSDADGASGVGATVNATNAANGTLVISAANSTGFGGSVQLRKVTFTAAATIGHTGSLKLLVSDLTAAGTFTSLLATTLAVTYPLILR